MAKYNGKIGYGVISEVRPGVYEESITERYAYGDILRNSRKANTTDSVNADLTVGNHISIVADAYASTHFFAMRYIEWAGALWYVQSVEVKSPRLILMLGGVYNGPTAPPPPDPPDDGDE